jgi:adenine phosphoribosyltransferase
MPDLQSYITDIPDFPEQGIIFRDITSLLQSADGFQAAVDALRQKLDGVSFDTVAGLDARGFLFAAPVAYAAHKGVLLVRKKGKLPRETVSASYALEYGTAEVELHTDAVHAGDKVVIIDDLLATGGTLEAAVKLVEQLGGQVVKILTLIALQDLGGRERLRNYDVESIVTYTGK